MESPLDGGATSTLVTRTSSGQQVAWPVTALATDGVRVYFSTGEPGDPVNGYICSVSTSGGSVTTLASDIDGPDSLLLRGTTLVWHDVTGLRTLPTTGGTPQNAFATGSVTRAFTADLMRVYDYLELSAFVAAPLDGGATTTLLSAPQAFPEALAVDDVSLYWVGENVVRYGLR
jgi:hypothetical protein